MLEKRQKPRRDKKIKRSLDKLFVQIRAEEAFVVDLKLAIIEHIEKLHEHELRLGELRSVANGLVKMAK